MPGRKAADQKGYFEKSREVWMENGKAVGRDS